MNKRSARHIHQARPQDRVVYPADGERWAQFRWGGKNPRYHDTQEAALRQAARLLNHERAGGRLLLMVKKTDDGEPVFRLVRTPIR